MFGVHQRLGVHDVHGAQLAAPGHVCGLVSEWVFQKRDGLRGLRGQLRELRQRVRHCLHGVRGPDRVVSKRVPGHQPGGVLLQRRRLPAVRRHLRHVHGVCQQLPLVLGFDGFVLGRAHCLVCQCLPVPAQYVCQPEHAHLRRLRRGLCVGHCPGTAPLRRPSDCWRLSLFSFRGGVVVWACLLFACVSRVSITFGSWWGAQVLVSLATAQTPAWQVSYCASVTTALSIAAYRCSVNQVEAGSALVSTQLASDPANAGATSSSAAATQLVQQAASGSSPLTLSLNGGLGGLDTTFPVTIKTTAVCSDGVTYTYSASTCPPAPVATDDSMSTLIIVLIAVGAVLGVALLGAAIWGLRKCCCAPGAEALPTGVLAQGVAGLPVAGKQNIVASSALNVGVVPAAGGGYPGNASGYPGMQAATFATAPVRPSAPPAPSRPLPQLPPPQLPSVHVREVELQSFTVADPGTAAAAAAVATADYSAGPPKWPCPDCTFLNHAALGTCEVCGRGRPVTASVAQLQGPGGKAPLRPIVHKR